VQEFVRKIICNYLYGVYNCIPHLIFNGETKEIITALKEFTEAEYLEASIMLNAPIRKFQDLHIRQVNHIELNSLQNANESRFGYEDNCCYIKIVKSKNGTIS